MSSTSSLALQHRPKVWEELVGQRLPRTFFERSLTPTEEYPHGKFWPAYLLHGKTGSGKTSSALLLAKRALCQDPQGANPCNACKQCKAIERSQRDPNLEYIDGTTDRGLDFVNNHIKKWLLTSPVGDARLKVMIIDEFHRYTADAKSAFLIILEELKHRNPRALVVLCTTESDQIDPAIKNRCINLHFGSLPADEAARYLASKLDMPQHLAMFKLLVEATDGSMREVWQALDVWQTLGEPLNEDLVQQLIRGVRADERAKFWSLLAARQVAAARKLWDRWRSESAEPRVIARQLEEDMLEAMTLEPLRVEWLESLRTMALARRDGSEDLILTALLTLQIPLAPTEVLRQARPNTYVPTFASATVPAEAAPEVPATSPAPEELPTAAVNETEPADENEDAPCARCGKLSYPGHACKLDPPGEQEDPEISEAEPGTAQMLPDLTDHAAVARFVLGR